MDLHADSRRSRPSLPQSLTWPSLVSGTAWYENLLEISQYFPVRTVADLVSAEGYLSIPQLSQWHIMNAMWKDNQAECPPQTRCTVLFSQPIFRVFLNTWANLSSGRILGKVLLACFGAV